MSLDHPIEIGWFGINGLGSPKEKTEMFCRCLGMIRIQWYDNSFGFGEVSDAREGSGYGAKWG